MKISVVKIDVVRRELIQIKIDQSLPSIYEALECFLFDVIRPKLHKLDAIYIDDEGLLAEEPIGAFSVKGYHGVFSGHGLVIGLDEEGASTNFETPLSYLKQIIKFEDTHYLPEPSFSVIEL